MKNDKIISEPYGFRYRKLVHYSLIFCILFIQLIIAAFFYNEFVKDKKLTFVQKQLEEIHALENLTDQSRKEILNAQGFLQKFMSTKDENFLESYFASLKSLDSNLANINRYENKFPKIKELTAAPKASVTTEKVLKKMIDSTQKYTSEMDRSQLNALPDFKKYNLNYDFEKFNVVLDTKVYSDTIKKKGLFGRLGEAISGKGQREKDSVVITVKEGVMPSAKSIKADFDRIIKEVNNHYTVENNRIKIRVKDNQVGNDSFYNVFNDLFVYSNGLMNVYETAVKSSKSDLEKEYENQKAKNNEIRKYLVFGSMILMFIVSVLIMILTRIAFVYEKKLNKANLQITENLNFRNRILGMLSHELRSPLKIMDIFIRRIKKKTTDESIQEYLKSISFTNNTLLIQANQILDYTKNQQAENKLIPVEFNLKNEIDAILNSVQPYIETRDNRFVVEQDIDAGLQVYSDNNKINQIFMNILGNANKFTENGEIKVVTKAFRKDENTVTLNTVITDTGVGISSSDLEKIFEPYYQGVISDKVENLGAGLGLSLCRELAQLYSGDIKVESEKNVGTRVEFSLNLDLKNDRI
ncbi:HAMP domain-containing sensor histidine kinase [Chryseobacterium sp. Leaf394]|uniref:sensor histidine kinase n=1 Tax=Chryseobacterium sp. Leaf394 TaxID=1736361 RepID=UPI000700DE80|nr:HAMP domain-containing sensor histidine kinase [Chryseobacterium sp. Leaf394]KQS89375.1 histidine kinase [Chryseobacterium sp. Leaf394]